MGLSVEGRVSLLGRRQSHVDIFYKSLLQYKLRLTLEIGMAGFLG